MNQITKENRVCNFNIRIKLHLFPRRHYCLSFRPQTKLSLQAHSS